MHWKTWINRIIKHTHHFLPIQQKIPQKNYVQLAATAEKISQPLPELIIKAQKIACTFITGHHGYRQSGIGQPFWQYRQANPGDPLSTIDWRQSAKSDKLFIKEREQENSQTFNLWCDVSGSMQWQSKSDFPTKQEQAFLISLVLSYMLLKRGEYIKILSTDLYSQAFSGLQNFLALSKILIHQPVSIDQTVPVPSLITSHSWVIGVSDFLFPASQFFHFIENSKQSHHRTVLIHIFDPAEATLPYKNHIEFKGLETKEKLTLSITTKNREKYQHIWQNHQDQFDTYCREKGITLLHYATNSDLNSLLTLLWKIFTEKR